MILLAAGLVSGASAQYHGHIVGGYYGVVRPPVYVGGYYGPFYSPYYAYPGLYFGWGYPYPPYAYPYGFPYGHVPTKLEGQIADIKADYADRIKSVKADETLSHKEKRHQIHQLKQDRDNAVANAVRNYWKTPPPSSSQHGNESN